MHILSFSQGSSQIKLLFTGVILVGVVVLYVLYSNKSMAPDASVLEDGELQAESPEEMPQTVTADEFKGTHIMQNGDVMTGSGKVLEEASIQPDGSILLPNGEVIVPVADYRK